MQKIVSAEDLADLRRAGMQRNFSPEEIPANISTAYAIASKMLTILSRPIAAWKLGATTAGTRKAFSTEKIYFGALTYDEIWVADQADAFRPPPIFSGEAEIAFRLATDIETGVGTTILASDKPEDIFDAWAPAIEAPYSCVGNLPGIGLNALLMDRCAAGALYLGAPRSDICDPQIEAELEILIDDEPAARGIAGKSLLMSPIEAALEFINISAEWDVSLVRGQWISTGGITPCIEIPRDSRRLSLRLGGEEVFTVKFELVQE